MYELNVDMSRHIGSDMPAIHAIDALLPDGWARNVRVVHEAGRIVSVTAGAAPGAGDATVTAMLPALGNLHSHSFQRAMAGMTEHRAGGRDNFWSWRELMYRFLDHLAPDDIEAIAALAFMEMQEAGYAAVAEFHYLHNAPGGEPYAAPDELTMRIYAAAAETGIGLTHLPVLYAYGGTGEKPLAGGQLRFGNDIDRFIRLAADARAGLAALPADCALGIAPHSLRATTPAHFAALAEAFPAGPVHIHAAEQPKEVEDTLAWLGARPVEWLLANASVDRRWCIIHCTHMTEAETRQLAASGAVAGLCPLTESNLGDGVFNGATYLGAKGFFGIGSDSCIRITVSGELSTLEYTQRLTSLSRNALAMENGSTGGQLYRRALEGGARALARDSGTIEAGRIADLVALDVTHPALCALDREQWIDGWLFAAPDGVVADTWSAGRHCVRNGRHVAHEQITSRYRKALRSLMSRI
jgi:formimidoylglutamate deiminase